MYHFDLVCFAALSGFGPGSFAQSRIEQASTQSILQGPQTQLSLSTLPAAGSTDAIEDALQLMQDSFFEVWTGTWPTAIDWTSAVINTYVSGSLETLLSAVRGAHDSETIQYYDDLTNTIFQHNVAFYFGENAFELRNQAYDDMLWVVLGWLESIKFIERYDEARHRRDSYALPWHGKQFIPAFAHRARIFYDLASRGWDTSLCGGGMNWNPKLEPYKNAITNQLFISASISMYLYFPGDRNKSPFLATGSGPVEPHQKRYLESAVEAYAWLKASNMTNKQGLYVDGYHVRGWKHRNSTGTGRCDARNEMVYTYNQAVLLTGLRGLWESTGNVTYLTDGHRLVEIVITATGWDLASASTFKNSSWSGLGRAGILEEYCDHTGQCSQDAQTFKGIFFQHLTQFCEALPRHPLLKGRTFAADEALAFLHRQSCRTYGAWALHNAEAAKTTQDENGLFGGWWAPQKANVGVAVDLPVGASDYRNEASFDNSQRLEGGHEDVNGRGRGRTVETQGGGLSVLRAAWELLDNS